MITRKLTGDNNEANMIKRKLAGDKKEASR